MYAYHPHHQVDFDIDVTELDETSPSQPHPPGTKIVLKPHQLTLLARCKHFESSAIPISDSRDLRDHAHEDDVIETQVGIIGDRVGAGKSFVVLALISDDTSVVRNEGLIRESFGNNRVVRLTRDRRRVIRTNLLVIPHNLCSQWEGYIRAYSDTLKCRVINKQRALDVTLQEDMDTIEEFDLVVVTTTYYNRFVERVNSRHLKFRRVFFDEVDNLHLPSCQPVEALFFWFITASYGNLLYPRGLTRWDPTLGHYIYCAHGLRHAGFVKSLFVEIYNHLSRDYMKLMVIKNSEAFVESSTHLPDIINNYVRCRTPPAINILHGIVDKQIIAFLNAGDINAAMQFITPNNRTSEDNIVHLMIDRYTRQLRNLEARTRFAESYDYDTDAERQNELTRLQTQREETQARVDAIQERIRHASTCAICMEEEIEKKCITPCCSNAFCFVCINRWMANRKICPMCKNTLTVQNILVVDEDATGGGASTSAAAQEDDFDDTVPNERYDKIKNLELVLRRLPRDAKTLIFSSYEHSFESIGEVLDGIGLTHKQLKGNGAQVRCIVESYKSDAAGHTDALLLNARSAASGLNLENTTDVIMFHKFDTEIEKQIVGRAQRYGRTCPLRVWYLMYDNEMSNVPAAAE
jgi:SNF2 family DNA or RNA helicase